jgi:hypothetical protein
VLVSLQLLNLTQVGSRAEKLGGEDVAQCVRRYALARRDAGRRCIAAEGRDEDRGGEAMALHAHEQRRVTQGWAGRLVCEEQRHEAGVQR